LRAVLPGKRCRPPGKGLPPCPAAPGNLSRQHRLAHRLLITPRTGRAGVHMANGNLFGVHGAALEVRAQRMNVLASNIANASTPNFKARDIDFNQALASVERQGGVDQAMLYRTPDSPSMDGNTVELNKEQTAFAENAVQYQTTLSFLNGRINQLTRALKGE
jgi:flagellar basal-body rod protein FlgB